MFYYWMRTLYEVFDLDWPFIFANNLKVDKPINIIRCVDWLRHKHAPFYPGRIKIYDEEIY